MVAAKILLHMYNFRFPRTVAGLARGTMQWMTTLNNEEGQVLIIVLTAMEGSGFDLMAKGLVKRYAQAGQIPPKLQYIDCDCCKGTGGETKLKERSHGWMNIVQLDIYKVLLRPFGGHLDDSLGQLFWVTSVG